MKKQLGLSLLLASISSASMADSGAFLSADVGAADLDGNATEFTYAIGGGYQFNDYFEVELGYRDFGTDDDGRSFFGNLNIGAPIAQNSRVFLIVGYQQFRFDETSFIDGSTYSETHNTHLIGLGFAHKFNDQLSLRLKAQAHGDSNRVKTYSA
ncbi:MAG: porin family protein, partial [Cellvibrionaceae bacterium]|nr:porin family protein [Cellvibrionaceae bacterium]